MPSSEKYGKVKKMLESKGYELDRIKGSHHIFVKSGNRSFAVPVHHGEVKHVYVRQIKKI